MNSLDFSRHIPARMDQVPGVS